jgi:hypothetical protein
MNQSIILRENNNITLIQPEANTIIAVGSSTSGPVGPQGPQGTAGDWTTAQTISTPTITSNAYSILSTDNGKLLLLNNSSTAMTLNVNTGVGLIAGQKIDMIQTGSGQVTVGGTATINSSSGKKFRVQYSGATLICRSTNNYILIGDLTT